MASPTRTDKSQFHSCFASFIPTYLQPRRSSRIEELLLSNKPPLEFEKHDLVDTAARGPQILRKFDKKIAAARQLLDFLGSERDQAASNISDAQSILHPVRRLPDDVLRLIFRACTKSADQVFNGGSFVVLRPEIDIESIQPNQSPWTISCVCRHWRALAIDTGELWSFIELNLDNRPEDKELAAHRMFKLNLSLSRAKGHDLSIRLYGEKSVPDDSPILPILLANDSRSKRLSVFLPSSSFRHFSRYQGYLNHLDTLYIGSREPGNESLDTFRLAPSLKVLGTYIDNRFTQFSVPSSGITTFISGGPNLCTYESLKRLSRVQNLTLFCWDLIDEAAEPISLHSVTDLHLIQLPSGPLSITNMYSHLILPSLQHLELSFGKSVSPDQISFPAVTNPDSCSIKKLCIYLYRLSQEASTRLCDELIKFLGRTPKLNELYLVTDPETKLPDRWVKNLVYISGQDAIAPRLRLLSMPDGRISARDLRCLVKVIKSRRKMDGKHCALLEEVILGPEPVEFDDEGLSERWMALCAGGLIIKHREKSRKGNSCALFSFAICGLMKTTPKVEHKKKPRVPL